MIKKLLIAIVIGMLLVTPTHAKETPTAKKISYISASTGLVLPVRGLGNESISSWGLTQWKKALENDQEWLFSHLADSGVNLSQIIKGSTITVGYEDGTTKLLTVTSVNEHAGKGKGLFSEYKKSESLVLQTCIEKNGDLTWGILIIVAEP